MAQQAGPATVAEFKERVVAGLRVANPGKGLRVEWEVARAVTYPSGLDGFVGEGRVVLADGSSSPFLATADKYGLQVR